MIHNISFYRISISISIVFIFLSCSKNSPKDVAKKALDCLISDNYEGYLNYSNLSMDKKEELVNSEITADFVFGKNNPNDHRVRVKSYILGKEKVIGDSVIIEYSYIYENNDTVPGVYDMLRVNGKWLINMR